MPKYFAHLFGKVREMSGEKLQKKIECVYKKNMYFYM